MLDAEAAYFDGYHVAHIAAYYEVQRLKAIDKRNRECFNASLRQRNRNRANEEGKDQGEVASAANREDVRSLQARLYQQV
jgi:hypothetical protein